MVLCFWIYQNRGVDLRTSIHVTECFAGAHEVTRANWAAGWEAVPFELELDPEAMDMLSDAGFSNGLVLTMKTAIAKVSAPVCSTWVYLSRASTQRSYMDPLGDQTLVSVSRANVMVVRVILLAVLCAALSVIVIIEQPVNSLMVLHPYFQKFLVMVKVFRKSIKLPVVD